MGLDRHLTRDDILKSVDEIRTLILDGNMLDASAYEYVLWGQALRAIAEGKHGTDPPELIAEAALRTRELGL